MSSIADTTHDYSNTILGQSDSYKDSHFLQYPPGTEYVSSYIESRGGPFKASVFFGLQAFIKDVLTKPITREQVEAAAEDAQMHGEPFNKAGWMHIVDAHGGKLPIEIRAVAEGEVVPVKNALVEVINTDPETPWLTSYVETALLRAVWYPTTVATNSWHCKGMIKEALEKTSDHAKEELPFKLHDFGARGVNCHEGAGIGGSAHLVNFMGTDTKEALLWTRKHYHERMAGFSIPAAEHSTITSWGREHEKDAHENMIDQFSGKYPEGHPLAGQRKLYAVVSDSYDIWNAIDKIWGEELLEKVRNSGGRLIVRPDSGDPLTVPIKAIQKLGEKFSFKSNSKGFNVLEDCVRVIQGDGISRDSIETILKNLLSAGLSADNLAFGMGGKLLQAGIDRDTMKWAMKASWMSGRDPATGQEFSRDVFKDPVDDKGKVSKKGLLALICNIVEATTNALGLTTPQEKNFDTVRREELNGREDMLKPVFRNGELLIDQKFSEIRERADRGLEQHHAMFDGMFDEAITKGRNTQKPATGITGNDLTADGGTELMSARA